MYSITKQAELVLPSQSDSFLQYFDMFSGLGDTLPTTGTFMLINRGMHLCCTLSTHFTVVWYT